MSEYPRSGNFTFKNYARTGRFASFDLHCCEIKHKNKDVGIISELGGRAWDKNPQEDIGKYVIRFMIKKEPTKEDPAQFKWVQLKTKCDTMNDAKVYVNSRANEIHKAIDLYHQET